MNQEAQVSTVTRLMRASIKMGDEFVTIEECVVLPIGARDTQITEAVATGLRIFHAQQSAIEEQISGLRSAPAAVRTPSLASPKQIVFIERLASDLGHSLDSAVEACGFTASSLTGEQASQVIKSGTIRPNEAMSSGRTDMSAPPIAPTALDDRTVFQPITEQQQRAIMANCRIKNLTIQQAIADHIGPNMSLEDLSQQQAGALITTLNELPPAAFKPGAPRRK